ncbi:MAG: 6-phosphogluconolactonase [Gammaproteobacteria bacterium]|nr:6-phosphogluconolactonase [Gammaproteobacteria bacterium]
MTTRFSSGPTVHRYADAAALYAAAAEAFGAQARSAIGAHGRFSVALAGGGTPRPLYEKLAGAPYRDSLDWSRVDVWFGDERCVPPDSPRSNYRMVSESLLRHVPLPAGNVHRMRGEATPVDAALAYEQELHAVFGDAAIPRLDLILLGVGGDGHTASLFPGTEALHERERLVCAQYVDVQREWRLTLTFPLLNAAASLWVLAHGADKAQILRRVFDGPPPPEALPIQRITPADGRLEWWLDAAAAADLPPAAA